MRKLRTNENHSNCNEIESSEELKDSERKLRVQNDELLKKADRLLLLKEQLSQREKETKVLKNEIAVIQSELLEYGKENNLESLTSNNAFVQFQSKVSRKIDPRLFLTFLADHGRAKDFYSYVDVPITNAIKNFGEAILESSGILMSTCHDYSVIKISSRI